MLYHVGYGLPQPPQPRNSAYGPTVNKGVELQVWGTSTWGQCLAKGKQA
jgi:hypothetical protein